MLNVINKKTLIIIVLGVSIFGYIFYLKYNISQLQNELNTTITHLQDCQSNKQTLQDSINNTNSEIDKWKSVSKQLEKDNNELTKTLNEMDKKINDEVNKIYNEPKIESCDEAINYLYDSTDELKWGE